MSKRIVRLTNILVRGSTLGRGPISQNPDGTINICDEWADFLEANKGKTLRTLLGKVRKAEGPPGDNLREGVRDLLSHMDWDWVDESGAWGAQPLPSEIRRLKKALLKHAEEYNLIERA